MLSYAFISLVFSFEASTYIIKLLHPYSPSQVLGVSDQGLLLILCTQLKSSLAKKKQPLEQLTTPTLHLWLIWSVRHLSSLCVLFCVVLVFIGASIKHFLLISSFAVPLLPPCLHLLVAVYQKLLDVYFKCWCCVCGLLCWPLVAKIYTYEIMLGW